ncbi:MAG: hemerythrin-like metal-binding protein [Clostridia bacterium]|jgi:hemerythrin|nr:hemerythrin-like metal-binding protein [Clostridia bacterium]
MAIEWKEDLAVGIKEIDDQHKELFSKVNALFDACNTGKGRDQIDPIIKYLQDYVVLHFGAEEKLQKQNNYPEFNTHKAQHDQFINDFLGLKDKIEKNGVTGLTIVQLNQVLVDWLIKHIRKTDKAFAGFLKEKGIS